ncbi:MAG TPA: LPS export ABC transporter permease LptF [Alphaproteobacteria bacterium]|nr:LPS export ABC transporter permease LptF [Alphaproteobacteria bacterium]
MNRITSYIFSQLLFATLLVTLTVTCAFWLTQSLRFIELIVNHGLSIASYLYMTMLLLPSLLSILLPIGFFLAMLFVYNRLTTDSELIVMRAVGLGPQQLAKPALILAVLVVLIDYLLTLVFMPMSYRAFRDIETDSRGGYAGVVLKEGAFNTVNDGVTVYVRSRGPEGELLGILIHDTRDPKKAVTIMAERGLLAQTSEGPRIIMVDGNRQTVDKADNKFSVLYFDRYSAELGRTGSGETTDVARWRQPRERYLNELLFPDMNSQMDRDNYNQLVTEGHMRLTSSLYGLAFALIALATLLPGDYNRRGQGKRIILAVAVMMILESGSVFWNGFVARHIGLTPMIYANVLVPSAIAAWWLFRTPRPRRAMALPEAAPA